ncbi:porphobilinogen deaminase [Anaerocolumna cellulosilytica]|uniref:Porphobilinogen deaminase n=1 Tax=Anaerocolumna cellulosilytica TaxID=433286 RepID=A0A6S6R006_9FIRM|nr:hydroxymethylbilane synthase [Anaerocolumna cellulosilytica]MBB5197153.1 hydroxymethylbilane synthase/uroporphyrinogen III methyltransferase/synthase [Anaerocolumna cellulosilytica]BCJ95366.1 porphobilinogen deaminase [Anaerocolumna cellulosilytica]
MKNIIRIGTRKSRLALAQTEIVANALKLNHPNLDVQLIPMSTIGDQILDKPLESFGGKGAFVSEFEEAMLSGKIDVAVHSAKDMPILLPAGLSILGVSKREDVRDVIITRKGSKSQLTESTIVGTSSLRRQLQIKEQYGVEVKNLRGNVNTRLAKLQAGEYDAIILAAAGLKRLDIMGADEYQFNYLEPDVFIPAAGQGIIAVEGRDEPKLRELFSKWNHTESGYSLETEREVLKLVNAGCNEPIGAYTTIKEDTINLSILYWDNKILRVQGTAKLQDRLELAKELVNRLKA